MNMTETTETGTHVLTKTLRDGKTQLAIHIEPYGSPDSSAHEFVLSRDGAEWARTREYPRELDKAPAPGVTHGLPLASGQAVGLTRAEANAITRAIENHHDRQQKRQEQQIKGRLAEAEARARAAAPDAPVFTISGPGSPCGIGSTVRLEDGRAVTGLAISRRYIREDGWSLGVMDESGWLYTTEVRQATAAEAAELEASEDLAARRDSLRAQGRELAESAGSAPEAGTAGVLALPGVRIEPARHTTAFGSEGAYQHLRADRENGALWVLTYNGTDGDNWSRSNCGPYIARRVPLTPETDALIAELAAEFGAIPGK